MTVDPACSLLFLQPQEDINEETLQRDRSYYTSNWNNVAWVTNVLLADATQGAPSKYGDRVRTFLRSWLTGDPVERTDSATKYGHTSPSTALENFTDADTGALYLVIPACVPTSTYENDCYDGVDNDCNGEHCHTANWQSLVLGRQCLPYLCSISPLPLMLQHSCRSS